MHIYIFSYYFFWNPSNSNWFLVWSCSLKGEGVDHWFVTRGKAKVDIFPCIRVLVCFGGWASPVDMDSADRQMNGLPELYYTEVKPLPGLGSIAKAVCGREWHCKILRASCQHWLGFVAILIYDHCGCPTSPRVANLVSCPCRVTQQTINRGMWSFMSWLWRWKCTWLFDMSMT